MRARASVPRKRDSVVCVNKFGESEEIGEIKGRGEKRGGEMVLVVQCWWLRGGERERADTDRDAQMVAGEGARPEAKVRKSREI